MKRKLLAIATSCVLILVTLACQLTSGIQAPSAPATPADTEIPVLVETAAPTEDFASETQAAEENQQATAESELATKEADAQAMEQATREAMNATAAAEEALVLTQSAEVVTQATAQAEEIANVAENLAEQGFLKNTDGTYSKIEDFNENWAQIGWYQWWNTGFEPDDFIIRAHTEWESASKTANWFDSGCGFVFRQEDEKNHYMIFLALDGNVYLKGYVDGVYKEFGKGYAGKIDHIKGGADVMLVVQGNRILYFVNDEKVLDRENGMLSSGKLALTLVSGTNKEYGTRCSITNIELWELDQ